MEILFGHLKRIRHSSQETPFVDIIDIIVSTETRRMVDNGKDCRPVHVLRTACCAIARNLMASSMTLDSIVG